MTTCGYVRKMPHFRKRTSPWGDAGNTYDFPEAEKFAETLARKFREVHFDRKTGHGWAKTGAGVVRFHESSNDPAVVVTIEGPLRFKGIAEDVWEYVEKIQEVMRLS